MSNRVSMAALLAVLLVSLAFNQATCAPRGRSYGYDAINQTIVEEWRDSRGAIQQRPILFLTEEMKRGRIRPNPTKPTPSPDGRLVAIEFAVPLGQSTVSWVDFVDPWYYDYYDGERQTSVNLSAGQSQFVSKLVWTKTEQGRYELVADFVSNFGLGVVEPVVVVPRLAREQGRAVTVANIHRIVALLMRRERRRFPTAYVSSADPFIENGKLWCVGVHYQVPGDWTTYVAAYDLRDRTFIRHPHTWD